MKVRWYETRHVLLLFFSVLIACILCSFNVHAADRIRVGCVDFSSFMKVDKDGHAVGYGAEYLNKISSYTGWQYEYVEAPWNQCLNMLQDGKIDLLFPAEFSEERARNFLFSDYECSVDVISLVGCKTDSRFYYEDEESFEGIRVGMIKGNYLNRLFDDYARRNGFTYEPVYYDARMMDALDRGEVDAILNGSMEYNMNQKLLAKIDYVPAYFITSVNNPGLMNELNQALKQIFMENPYYAAGLYNKYYKKQDGRFEEFTRQEVEFIRSSLPVTVLVSPTDFPFEWYDEEKKECRGAYVDYLKELGRMNGLHFKFIQADPDVPFRRQVEEGKAQVLLSTIERGNGEENRRLTCTAPFYNCTFSLVGKKDKKLDLTSCQRIAVVAKVGMQDMLEYKYPRWKTVSFDTSGECLDAVKEGFADCAMIASLKLSADKSLLGENLLVVDGSTADIPVYLGVSKDAPPLLGGVLSKMIVKAGEGAMDDAMYATLLSSKKMHRDPSYFIRTYPLYFAAGVIGASILAMAIIFICYDSRYQKIQNQILQKKNEELETAIELQRLLRRKAQTDALTGLKNKAATEEMCRICMERERGERCAFIILDLDDFKQINDERGHQAGDAVLRAIGATLKECIRKEDVAGRIGGDEFMLFMTGIRDREQVMRSVRRIFSALKGNPEFEATVSMGIVLAFTDRMTYEELFQTADEAMYKAKGRGKDKFCIEDFLDEETAAAEASLQLWEPEVTVHR